MHVQIQFVDAQNKSYRCTKYSMDVLNFLQVNVKKQEKIRLKANVDQ